MVLAREVTVAQAARRHNVSEQTVANWRKRFLDGGLAAFAGPAPSRAMGQDAALRRETEKLKAALADVQVEVRVWKTASDRLPPLRDLEAIRLDAGMPVWRFCQVIHVPRRTYTRWLSTARAGKPVPSLGAAR